MPCHALRNQLRVRGLVSDRRGRLCPANRLPSHVEGKQKYGLEKEARPGKERLTEMTASPEDAFFSSAD
jgi:hypothetical protein